MRDNLDSQELRAFQESLTFQERILLRDFMWSGLEEKFPKDPLFGLIRKLDLLISRRRGLEQKRLPLSVADIKPRNYDLAIDPIISEQCALEETILPSFIVDVEPKNNDLAKEDPEALQKEEQ